MEMLKPLGRIPIASLTGDGMRTFVEAEREMVDNMVKPLEKMKNPEKKGTTTTRTVRKRRIRRRRVVAKAAGANA
jgi:hypothetical protein